MSSSTMDNMIQFGQELRSTYYMKNGVRVGPDILDDFLNGTSHDAALSMFFAINSPLLVAGNKQAAILEKLMDGFRAYFTGTPSLTMIGLYREMMKHVLRLFIPNEDVLTIIGVSTNTEVTRQVLSMNIVDSAVRQTAISYLPLFESINMTLRHTQELEDHVLFSTTVTRVSDMAGGNKLTASSYKLYDLISLTYVVDFLLKQVFIQIPSAEEGSPNMDKLQGMKYYLLQVMNELSLLFADVSVVSSLTENVSTQELQELDTLKEQLSTMQNKLYSMEQKQKNGEKRRSAVRRENWWIGILLLCYFLGVMALLFFPIQGLDMGMKAVFLVILSISVIVAGAIYLIVDLLRQQRQSRYADSS